MPNALYEDGDATEAVVHRQAERPLRLVRPVKRFLRPIDSPEGPRGVHYGKYGRTTFTVMCLAYEMEPSPPLYFSKFLGRVREQATGSRGECSPGSSSETLRKGKENVASPTPPAHGSTASPLRG